MLGLNSHGWAESFVDSITPTYTWGRGISWPAANFNIGGYFDSSYQYKKYNKFVSKDRTALTDLSLFISWSPHEQLRFFSEVEVQDVLATEGQKNLEDTLRAERLYIDYLANDSITLRLGKFLTPIGRWNVIHAAPLIWTTTRPLVTDKRLFTDHSVGAMLTQKFEISEHNLDVSFFVDDSRDFDVFDTDLESRLGFENAIGGRLNFEVSEDLQIGMSYMDYKNNTITNLPRNRLAGIDLLWKKNGYEIQIESIYRQSNNEIRVFENNKIRGQDNTEIGLFAQSVIPLTDQFFVVGRYEYLEGIHDKTKIETHVGVTGLAWRPFVPLVIKSEYRFTDGIRFNQTVVPTGFFASVSMFF